MKIGSMIMIVVLLVGIAAWGTTDLPAEEPATIIENERMLGQCLEQVQREYFPVCIPSLSERLLQPAGSFPVSWDSFNPETRKLFGGWIDENGIVKYSVGLYQDYWSDEIVVMDANSGRELFRIPREKGYDKFDLQREVFGKVLEDEYTRNIFLPAKISTLVDLIPFVFWDAHVRLEQQEAAERQAENLRYATEASPEECTEVSVGMALVSAAEIQTSAEESEPIAMAMTSEPPSVPNGDDGDGESGGGGGSTSNLVELTISIPQGFGYMDHIEILFKDDLIYDTSWELAGNGEWVPTLGSQTVHWIDPASVSNLCAYYLITDGIDTDGDGRSDFLELASGSDPYVFDTEDKDNDGINDWWEEKIFGGTNYSASIDSDEDDLMNNEEVIFNSMGSLIAMISDPTLKDSDRDGVEDWPERMTWHTEPMNPDTDGDGLNDGAEINASPRTDPHNDDTSAPTVAFWGN